MKGTIIDYNDFEAMVILSDDSVVNIPISKAGNYLSRGSNINLNYSDINCSTSYKSKLNKDKFIDFF